MHRLEKIVIRGFRGQGRPIELDLKPDANFLIGRNGTGKTTLINLINAALSINLPLLRESDFERIDFIFKRPRYRTKPRFSVIKSFNDEGFPAIWYRVADTATAPTDDYTFSRIKRRINVIGGIASNRDTVSGGPIPLRDRLASIYRTTWLSLQRGADNLAPEEEWEGDSRSDIDRKLNNLSNELTRYFSRLDRLVSEKTQIFQKEWFLSFLANDRRVRGQDINHINDDSERAALTSIFSDFNMEPATYASQLERHFRLARRAKAAFKANEAMQVRDYFVAADVMRLHSLVEQWQELESAKEDIYDPKEQFEIVASDMLFRKRLYTGRSNQIVVETEFGEFVPLEKLSSGEKQLLIFLSETLLQERHPYIFLADEPELSMHVEWQEELVPAILKINPNAQVFFATHSPDVVNKYQNNVFKMEELAD